ncbi:MAG: CHAP domain-containing protein [Solobacterium sp.]|nr:CHAP domain-containing protein [Solobacterium sp.]
MKKRILSILFVSIVGIHLLPVQAEEDFSNTSYWNQKCTSYDLSENDKASCEAYMVYMKEQNTVLQQQLDAIDSKKNEISENIDDYASKINSFNQTIHSLNDMMQDLNIQIAGAEKRMAEMQESIKKNQREIKEKKKEVEELEERIEARMVEEQKTMRINPFIDIIMGAKTFDEFIRILNGIKDINDSDVSLQTQLSEGIKELEEMNGKLEEEQKTLQQVEMDLTQGKEALANQQASLLASQYEAELIRQTYVEQYNEVLEEQKFASSAVNSNTNVIGNVDQSLQNQTSTSRLSNQEEAITNPPSDSSSESTSSSIPTPTQETSTASTGDSSQNPYYGGWSNCTWGAWQLVHDNLGISLPGWGWSTNWIHDAAASGYPTGSEPRVNSIAVYENHVAFVTAVDGDQVYIKEGNYLGSYAERWVSKDELPWTGQRCLGYIYL